MIRKRRSHNERILNYLVRRGGIPSNFNANYMIFYTFLYKYLSDKLKNHLTYSFGCEGDNLKSFYLNDESKADIREVALNEMGYFIESHDAYIDQLTRDRFADDLLHPSFLLELKENIVFSRDNPCKRYFDIVSDVVERQLNYYNYDVDQEVLISNYLMSIAKLDLEEEEFSFRKVYDLILSSREIPLASTPEYISQIIEEIILAKKDNAETVYDPFLRDASVLFNVSKHFEGSKVYGKEMNGFYYFYSIVKAFIYEFDFNDVSLMRESAIRSMAYDDELFDVIVSKIMNDSRHFSNRYRKQHLEVPNSKKMDIKEQLISQLDLSNLSEDEELLNALKVVEKKVEASEKSNVADFGGEYESLIDSEFLFLINMINCLKEDGIMAVSLSQNFLFKKSLTTLRKFLTYEKNYIDTIISLPEELGGSIRPEVIIVFRKNKNIKDVLFIDLSKEYSVVPSKVMLARTRRRNLIFGEATLAKVRQVLKKRQSIDKFSQLIQVSELERNDFNLTVSRYVDTFEGDFIRLEDLESTKEEIDANLSSLNKKIDLMMRELGL